VRLGRRRLVFGSASLLALAGCSSLPWLGSPEEAPLPGKRIPVLLLDEGPKADPRLAELRIVLPPPRRNLDWPQAGGNARHAMHHLELSANPVEVWRISAGRGSDDTSRLMAPPVVAAGRVFTVDTALVVRAFDLATGRGLWQTQPDLVEEVDRLRAGGLAYEDGRLFLTTTSGEIVALEAEGGRQLWRQAVRVAIDAPPTVLDGRLFVRTMDNRLLALDALTGTPLWQHAGFVEPAGILGGAAPAATREVVIAAYSSGEVFALRWADGRPLWSDAVLRPRRTLAIAAIADITAAPVIDDDRVYVAGNGGEMAAIALDRGTRLWDIDLTARETPWLAGDFIYLLTNRNEVVCLLRNGGHVRWVSPLGLLVNPDDPGSRRVIWTGPLLAGDRLVCASSEGEAVSVSPYSGEVLGRIALPGPVRLPPVLADGTLIFLTESGDLVAWR
jgi:outer membrane protein assembly factor BamB